jgi:F0F1-type ATP synthase delta subunit
MKCFLSWQSWVMVLNLCIRIGACLQSLSAPTLSHCFYQPVDTKFDPRPAIRKIIKNTRSLQNFFLLVLVKKKRLQVASAVISSTIINNYSATAQI